MSKVSQSAVSRILNGRAQEFGIPDEIADRVRVIAEALNYKPNLGAQMLLGRQTKLIGVVVRSFEDRFLAALLDELNTRALEAGYVLLVVGLKNGQYNARETDLLRTYRPDAFVIVGTTDFTRWDSDFLDCGKLIIQIGMPVDDPRVLTCGTDELQAAQSLVKHLIDLGHRSFGILGDCTITSRMRLNHVKALLRDHAAGVSTPCLYLSELESTEGGRDCAEYLLRDIPRAHWPTALIATGDMIALSMMRCLTEKGVAVPGELSIVSTGDIDFAALASPSLTTVHQPGREMAAASIEIITGALPRESRLLPTQLMARESSGRARSE